MILVTGGTGFVGSQIVRALRVESRPVRALVRDEAAGATSAPSAARRSSGT